MGDFQIFSHIKRHLNDRLTEQAIYFTPHVDMKRPCCIIELEEIWSNTMTMQNGIKTKIKFKTTCYSDDNLLSSQVGQSQKVVSLLDGLIVDFGDGLKAVIKFSETIMNTPNKAAVQSVSQVFETIVRAC